jgi:inner membrane protein
MDPLTQGLLGASFGQALYGRSLGRRARVWGGVVGMAPDLDVVMGATGPMAEWLWHRGPTHALWVGPVIGPLVGLLLWRWKGGQLRDWVGLAMVALFTHPLLDLFTTYGTQLLAPFSRERFSLDAIAIIDPLYSVVLAGGLAVGVWRGTRTTASRAAAWVALVASTAYLFLGLAVNHRAQELGRSQLAAEGVTGAQVAAYPTMLQLPLRRLVARSGDEVRVGFVSVLAPRPIAWERFRADRGPLVEAARATEEARILEWFASGQTAAKVLRADETGQVVEIDDLRYGLPGNAEQGLWGVRVRLDGSGQPLGPGERIMRPLPLRARSLFGQLWRGTIGADDP